MFELKQKILAAFLDSVRMAHRIGKHSVRDLCVRRTQVPLGTITVETRAQYMTRDWDASKQNGTDFCGVTVIRRVMQGHKKDAFLAFCIIFYCFPPSFRYYLHFLFFCFVRVRVRVYVCVCARARARARAWERSLSTFQKICRFLRKFLSVLYQEKTTYHQGFNFLHHWYKKITDTQTCEPKCDTNNKKFSQRNEIVYNVP